MFEIGSSLRQARQHGGLDLADVERATHIRAKYLGALEEERFEILPGVAYVRGFLRTYADFLGLNGNLYVEEYNVRFAPPDEAEPPISRLAPRRRQLHLARPIALLAAVLAAGTVVVWQLGFSPAKHTTITQERLVGAAAADAVTPKTRPKARPAAAPKAKPAVAAPRTLVIRATRGTCWVAVRIGSSTGKLVYERVLEQGGTLRFGLAKPLWVRLGAPWNADVIVRGKPLTSLPSRPVDLTAS